MKQFAGVIFFAFLLIVSARAEGSTTFLIERNELISCETTETTLVVPASVDGAAIIKIKYDAFSKSPNLREITLLPGITTLGWRAFADCPVLERVVLPQGITEIPVDCFAECPKIQAIEIPRSVTHISDLAFPENARLTIYGYKRSEAWYFAESMSCTFIVLDSPTAAPSPVTTFTFNANGGKIGKKKEVALAVPCTPPKPKREGYIFKGWTTSRTGSGIKPSATMTQNTTFYAHWQIKQYTVIFRGNGGIMTGTTKTTRKYNARIGKFPQVKRAGYWVFEGWYTRNGDRVTTNSIVTKNITVFARWSRTEPATVLVSSGKQSRIQTKSFSFYCDGEYYSMEIEIYAPLYKTYRSWARTDLRATNGFRGYVTPNDNGVTREICADIAKNLMIMANGDREYAVRLAVCFVQSLRYISDPWGTEYPKYVYETLCDGGGDCEDTAILLCALLRALGQKTATIVFAEHVGVGLVGSALHYGSYYDLNGVRYFYIETTGKGFDIGVLPPKLYNQFALVFPV